MSSTRSSDVKTSSINISAGTADLSRPRLRHLSGWIRDELDPVVAREGPESLAADDVLFLHDLFHSLRVSTRITGLDLRTTGIHRALMEISGIATRWPGRLCDDCNKVIKAWTSKFGRLQDLHPPLYGRGGCLEGIASGRELSKQALMRRWENDCPETLASSVSHKHGNLGFRAGSWWINSLFAWHAGIIDYDTVEGGVCFDKDTAYALFLKNDGELEAPTETHFTYRCSQVDRGTFRLTAATPKSRNPIRVLRSHSLNSIWGPRAGVRYEGLYRVVGWSIGKRKASDRAVHQRNPSTNILYDIHFQRDDPLPMEEVLKAPTAFQVDEFCEYKRLRKVLRESQRNRRLHPDLEQRRLQSTPPEISPQLSPIQSRSPTPTSRSGSRMETLGRSISHEGSNLPSSHPTSKRTVTLSSIDEDATQSLFSIDSAMQTQTNIQQVMGKTLRSTPSGINRTHSHESDLRDIAPWVGHDPCSALPLSEPNPPARAMERDKVQPEKASPQSGRSGVRVPSPFCGNQKKDEKKCNAAPTPPVSTEASKKNEGRALLRVRSRQPTTKHLDGAEDQVDSECVSDHGTTHPRRNSIFPKPRALTSPGGQPPRLTSDIFSTPDYSKPRSRSRRDAIFPVDSALDLQVSPKDANDYLNTDRALAIEKHEAQTELPCLVLVNFRIRGPRPAAKRGRS